MKRLPVLPLIAVCALLSACSTTPDSTPTPSATAPVASATATSPPPPTAPAEPSPAWRRIADIPTGRSKAAVAFSERSGVYVVGGLGGPTRVERYNPKTGLWERLPDLPIGVVEASAAAVEGLQNNSPQGVFVFGGYLADGSATARSFLFSYGATRWEEIAPMPAQRAAGAAVAIGSGVFIVGGSDGSGLVAPTYNYDVHTQQWRTVAAIPTPRDHLAAVGDSKSRACAIGGRQSSPSLNNLATFECYDPMTDTWARMPDTPFASSGAGAVEYDGLLYVIGGDRVGGTSGEVDIFNTRTTAWSRGVDLPGARSGLGVVAIPWSKDLDTTGKNVIFTPARLLVLAGAPAPGVSPISICEAMDLPWSKPLPPGAQIATPTP